jgi:thioesterase domain-containing protein
MARQLRGKGDAVRFLGGIDCVAPNQDYYSIYRAFTPRFFVTLLKETPGILIRFARLDNGHKNKKLIRLLQILSMLIMTPLKLVRKREVLDEQVYPAWVYRNPEGFLRENAKKHHNMNRKYTPGCYSGKMILFAASSRDDISYIYRLVYPDLGWKPFVKEYETVYVRGDHHTIVEMPGASDIANKINECLAGNKPSFVTAPPMNTTNGRVVYNER